MFNELLLEESLILNEFFKSSEEKEIIKKVKRLEDKDLVNKVLNYSVKVARDKGVRIIDNPSMSQVKALAEDETSRQHEIEENLGGTYGTDYAILSVGNTKVVYIATVDRGTTIKTTKEMIGYFYVPIKPNALKTLKLVVPK